MSETIEDTMKVVTQGRFVALDTSEFQILLTPEQVRRLAASLLDAAMHAEGRHHD